MSRNDKHKNTKLTRRDLLKSTVAIGISTTLVGCQDDSAAAPDSSTPSSSNNSSSTSNQEHASHRIYIAQPNMDRFYASLQQLDPRPALLRWRNVRHIRASPEETHTPEQRSGDWVVWASKEEAQKLSDHESILSLKTMDSPVEVGDATQAKGKLAVRLYPHSSLQTLEQLAGTQPQHFATTEAVVASWKKSLAAVKGINFSIPKTKTDQHAMGDLPEEGQILIEFQGEQLDPQVLSVIKSHRQVVAYKWGDLFRYFYCPGCGMG